MDPVRWGILGAANFAANQMAPAINTARNSVLVGLATSSAGKAVPFQAIAPGLRVFDSYDALLSDPDIDAVYVQLPNHLHVEWTLKALAAGKPVLTEKPIAMSAPEIDTLIAARDASGLLAAEAYMIVHHPQWQRVKALLAEGAIGELVHVDTVFSYNNAADPGNIRNRPETGGGSVPDIGVYTFGSAQWTTGEEPTSLTASIQRENGVDVFTHVTGDFPSFRYSSVTTMRMNPHQHVTFHGRDGMLRLTAPFNPGVFAQAELELHRPSSSGAPSVTVERWPGVNQYVLQVEAFSATIRTGIPYPWTLEDARGTQAMIDKVFASETP